MAIQIDSYLQKIMQEHGTKTTTEVAKAYGISARELNMILVTNGVQRKSPNGWEISTFYSKDGLVTYSEFPFMRSKGQMDASYTMKWTQRGRILIHGILVDMGKKPRG